MPNKTTPPTDAELNELLGKPGPPIEIDPDQLAAAVALQRAEAMSGTAGLWRWPHLMRRWSIQTSRRFRSLKKALVMRNAHHGYDWNV